jgi:DNA-binding CsgD family transcriptional regulator
MLNLDDLAWHRAMGTVLDALDREDFWLRLTRLLADYVHFNSWVALCFSQDSQPQVLAEVPQDDGQPDILFAEYLRGLYLLDPFYIDAVTQRKEGLVRLDDVAPDRFRSTEYYSRYFRLNIVEDEVQINCLLDEHRMLCLSLGATQRFSPADMAMLAVVSQWLIPLLKQRWRLECQLRIQPRQIPLPAGTKSSFQFPGVNLTARELEISQLMLSGYSSKGIAQRLGIAIDTVKAHRKHLYSKLGINSQGELFSLFLKDSARSLG